MCATSWIQKQYTELINYGQEMMLLHVQLKEEKEEEERNKGPFTVPNIQMNSTKKNLTFINANWLNGL